MEILHDLETMSLAANAAIVAIGATAFNKTGVKDKFYMAVTLESSQAAGLDIDANTIMFWLKQGDAARAALTADERYELRYALTEYAKWIEKHTPKGIWGNGSDFDNVILKSAARACTMKPLWDFRKNRCYRTLKMMFPDIKLERTGTYHHALHDAESQTEHCIRLLTKIGYW